MKRWMRLIEHIEKQCPSPYYLTGKVKIPKDPADNNRYRILLNEWAIQDVTRQNRLKLMSAGDILFWVNSFVYIVEPRASAELRAIPFCTWPYQDVDIRELKASIGYYSDITRKSRDTGGTWDRIAVAAHCFVFEPMTFGLFASRNEDLVDKPDDPDALMPKFDFIINHLPAWMKPNVVSRFKQRKNLDNGSVIDGESTTADIGRGGRRLFVFLDEGAAHENFERAMASTQHTTATRWALSTPGNPADRGGFAWKEAWKVPSLHDDTLVPEQPGIRLHGMRHRELSWMDHPEHSAGMYWYEGDELHSDPQYEYPPDFRFRREDRWGNKDPDGKKRSPWYDAIEDECISPDQVKLEVDMDDEVSDTRFFSDAVLDSHIERFCEEPKFVGTLDYDTVTHFARGFIHDPIGGKFRLWCPVDGKGRPHGFGECAIGVDIAAGGGKGSNSTISLGDKTTRKKILEYISKELRPDQLACMVFALARMFNCAKVCWESTGTVGSQFTTTLVHELRYLNVQFEEDRSKVDGKTSKKYGWGSTGDKKGVLLGSYLRALDLGTFMNPSQKAVEECRMFVVTSDNRVEHRESRKMRGRDAASTGKNHGDIVIADALLNMMFGPVDDDYKVRTGMKPPEKYSMENPAPFSILWYDKQKERELRQGAIY